MRRERLTSAYVIRDATALQALYGPVDARSIDKEIDYLHPHYAAFVRAAPLCILATMGTGGLDASPRDDPAGFVEIGDDKTFSCPIAAATTALTACATS